MDSGNSAVDGYNGTLEEQAESIQAEIRATQSRLEAAQVAKNGAVPSGSGGPPPLPPLPLTTEQQSNAYTDEEVDAWYRAEATQQQYQDPADWTHSQEEIDAWNNPTPLNDCLNLWLVLRPVPYVYIT